RRAQLQDTEGDQLRAARDGAHQPRSFQGNDEGAIPDFSAGAGAGGRRDPDVAACGPRRTELPARSDSTSGQFRRGTSAGKQATPGPRRDLVWRAEAQVAPCGRRLTHRSTEINPEVSTEFGAQELWQWPT